MPTADETVLCFSHLRWNFVYQRPQQLMSRCARTHRVIFFEEPIYDASEPFLDESQVDGITVAVPRLPAGTPADVAVDMQREMVEALTLIEPAPVLWYYTPMARAFSRVRASAVVYDCMDELSLFLNPPQGLAEHEKELLQVADVVFTGGPSLFAHKKRTSRHRNIHSFPSSVDAAHFAQARRPQPEPADQAAIPHPRIGYFGVIDERMDYELLAGVAAARPDLHLVMVGPVVKVDPGILPQAPNIHWLGAKRYAELPGYVAGWDVAMLPFARNDATRFISPTKTPEYLAAGLPVVSTSITDVIRPYGVQGLVAIADTPAAMIQAIDAAAKADHRARQAQADAFLKHLSWDRTWKNMWALVATAKVRHVLSRWSKAHGLRMEPATP